MHQLGESLDSLGHFAVRPPGQGPMCFLFCDPHKLGRSFSPKGIRSVMQGERNNKSWRDVDRKRDKSAHNQAVEREQRREQVARESTESRAAKSALEALFSPKCESVPAQEAPAAKPLQRVVLPTNPNADPRNALRRKLLAELLAATGARAICKAADEFFGAGMTLPDDQQVHLQLLEHTNPERVRDAIAQCQNSGRRTSAAQTGAGSTAQENRTKRRASRPSTSRQPPSPVDRGAFGRRAWSGPMMRASEFEARLRELVRAVSTQRQNEACVQCNGCERCVSCTFCLESKGLTRCHYCVQCSECIDCSHGRGCTGCLACHHCVASERCTRSAYLVKCSGCSDCSYCFGCVGLSHKDFTFSTNATIKTYFQTVEALTKEFRLGA